MKPIYSEDIYSEDIFSSYMSPWLCMSEDIWNPVLEDAILETYSKDTVIYHQGDMTSYLYLVKEGRVCLDFYAANGKKRSLYIADKGTCFGELSCFDQLPNYCDATTVTQTFLYSISKERFIQEIQNNPTFTFALLRTLSLKTRLITGLLEQLSFDDSYQRLYHSLMGLIERYGIKTKSNEYRLLIKFTHQEMAYQTGLSRVSVSNIFLSLTEQGYIRKENGYLVIKDIDALKEYCLQKE